ncbi:VCBS repeat-containing protein [Pseudohaliea sp.]|uniref:FG-GAP repeat domain-containing protein n=1 Tax=Pseudohaliea sp. TaxID=2740289 RepID=UPI0032EFA005
MPLAQTGFSPRTFVRGLAALLLLAGSAAGCGDAGDLASLPVTAVATETGVVVDYAAPALQPRHGYEPVTADFDGDGRRDFFLGGHAFSAGLSRRYPIADRVFLYRDGAYQPAPRPLPPGEDRHGCVAADLVGDGCLDLFCVAGAERGAGGHDNELWEGDCRGGFTPVPNFGAEYPTGRSRLARALDLDGDGDRDLAASVFGRREDAQPNATSLFRNEGPAGFTRIESCLPAEAGSRCLATSDLDGDGREDIVACAARQGVDAYVELAGDRCRAVPLFAESRRWQVLALAPLSSGKGDSFVGATTLDAAPTVVVLEGLRVEPGAGAVAYRSGFRLALAPAYAGCRVHSLAVGDLTADGIAELMLTLVDAGDAAVRCRPAAELLLLGPTFRRAVALESGPHRGPTFAAILNGQALRSGALPGSPGVVDLASLPRGWPAAGAGIDQRVPSP